MNSENNKSKKNALSACGNSTVTAFAVLIAIVAVFVAGMMYAKSKTIPPAPAPTAAPPAGNEIPQPPEVTPDINTLKIQDTDAVRGEGDILLVEYSDYECPFCQRFHPTVQTLVDSGEVAWVYRHLPLPFHATAKQGAIISDCVRVEKGAEAFWTYTDDVFAAAELNLEVYKSIARNAGLSDETIDACLAEGSSVVDQHINDAQRMGVNGTPGSFLLNTKTDAVQSIPGALPLSELRRILATVQ